MNKTHNVKLYVIMS